LRAGFTTFGWSATLHCLAFIPIKCVALHKSPPHRPQVFGELEIFHWKMLTTFKCPCSTWTVDFQHLKNLNAFIEYFKWFCNAYMPFVPGLEAQR
jgi:hypothetical protein